MKSRDVTKCINMPGMDTNSGKTVSYVFFKSGIAKAQTYNSACNGPFS